MVKARLFQGQHGLRKLLPDMTDGLLCTQFILLLFIAPNCGRRLLHSNSYKTLLAPGRKVPACYSVGGTFAKA